MQTYIRDGVCMSVDTSKVEGLTMVVED